jgi:hypothetical protein
VEEKAGKTLAFRLQPEELHSKLTCTNIGLGFSTKARSVLEQARQRNPKCPELWLEAVRIETRGEKKEYAKSLMAKGQLLFS